MTRKDLKDRIENDFIYHPPEIDQIDKFAKIRNEAKKMAILLAEQCPVSRELSLALTKLEETVMWANASIARNKNG